ncbi:MAG: amino acid ABC transporter permease [Nitrospira sp.]|nr:amino acid ABC transporter permease [bacterium]MBL7048566.1 amino acid ABC transporter permease [Nitrospira sp.]
MLVTGIKVTLILAAATTIFSLVLGTIVAILRISTITVFRALGTLYVEIFRNVPGLFWILFFYFIFPELLPEEWGQALNGYIYYPVVAGIAGLTVDNASYVSDILRSGRLSIPHGQREAAISSGLSRVQQYVHVLLPQMFRATLPPLGTRMVHNFKNTSLCMAISAPELTWATQNIESITFRGIEATTIATLFYVGLAGIMGAIIITLEKVLRIDVSAKKNSKIQ